MPEPYDNTKADTADTLLSDFHMIHMIQIFDLESLESTSLCQTCPSRFLSPRSGDAWDHACVACAAIRQENSGGKTLRVALKN